MSEIKEREITVKLAGHTPFAIKTLYSEKVWGWVSMIEAIHPATADQQEWRERVTQHGPIAPKCDTPYESLGEAVEWLAQAVEDGTFRRS